MDAPQGSSFLQTGIDRTVVIFSPPENLQRVYRPLQQLRQDFGWRLYCLRCAILLCADNGWGHSADLVTLFDIHRFAIGIADPAIYVQLQSLDGKFLLFLVPRQAGKSFRIDHAGQGFHLGPVIVRPIFQPGHLALAQAAQRHLLCLLRRREAGTGFAYMRCAAPAAETLVGLPYPADLAVMPRKFLPCHPHCLRRHYYNTNQLCCRGLQFCGHTHGFSWSTPALTSRTV